MGRLKNDYKKIYAGGIHAVVWGSLVGATLYAMFPRTALERNQQKVQGFPLPDVPYAHRGFHDAGSGLHTFPSSEEEIAYIRLARQMAQKAGFNKGASLDSTSCFAPENSLAAFAAACEMGWGIELDVRLTEDGRVAVAHDPDLNRVAGVDKNIGSLTYQELSQIPLFPSSMQSDQLPDCRALGVSDSTVNADIATATTSSTVTSEDKKPSDSFMEKVTSEPFHHVPLLEDVLKLVNGRVPLIIEYKFDDHFHTELLEATDSLLATYDGPYCIESFDPRALEWYRRYRPQVCRGQLSEYPALDMGERKCLLSKRDSKCPFRKNKNGQVDGSVDFENSEVNQNKNNDNNVNMAVNIPSEGADSNSDDFSDLRDTVSSQELVPTSASGRHCRLHHVWECVKGEIVRGAMTTATIGMAAQLGNAIGRPDFVAPQWKHSHIPMTQFVRKIGALCIGWTVHSSQEARKCSKYVDRMVFESWIPQTTSDEEIQKDED